MINKRIEDITASDLQSLIDNKVLEGKTIDYKKELPNNSDSSKKEFLADITSFANTSGGDLIFGIEQDNQTGKPKSPYGIVIENIDKEKTRLDDIIRSGVEPRVLSITIKPIPLSNSRYAILIRIPKSWISPHRVIFGGHAKFYARNSSGKYELDIDELRIAFNLTDTLTEKIRNFRAVRITKILADETPVPLLEFPQIGLHLIPVNAFNPAKKYDIDSIALNTSERLPLLYKSVQNYRYNLEGLLSLSNNEEGKFSAYTQLHRNGIIEAVDALFLQPRERNNTKITIIPDAIEEKLINATSVYLKLLSELTVELPVFIFLSFIRVKNYKMAYGNGPFWDESLPIDRDLLLLSEVVIENYGEKQEVEKSLKPLFDLLWNACGCPGSLNYNATGNRLIG